MRYVKPEIEIVKFDVNDVITASGEGQLTEQITVGGQAVQAVSAGAASAATIFAD